MTPSFTSCGRVAAVAVAFAAATPILSAQCGIDPNLGTNLTLGDDQVSAPQPLGFTFPFAGANYDSVCVSSNGFAYLFDSTGSLPAPTNSRCCNGSVTTLLASTSPMVCAIWQDLNPGIGGSVNFNALSGRALITWDQVPEFGQSNANTAQIALYPSGVIDLRFGAVGNVGHTALTGWSPGNGAADPGASDLTSLPIIATSATVYELFTNPTDLFNSVLVASPTGPASWVVDAPPGCASSARYGIGCPKPLDFYELFANATFDLSTGSLLFTALGNGAYAVTQCTTSCFDQGFTTNLNLGDDAIAANQQLGFTFPFAGTSTTAIDVCSNGYIWLVAGSSQNADYTASAEEFLAEPARLAPFWTDLDPSSGGGVYFDAVPGKALITWNQVPCYGTPGSNTFQVQLFPNGNFILAWPSALNNATTGNGVALTGFTQGNGVPDPGPTDLSAAVPFTTGNGIPLGLGAQSGARPAIGTTFTIEARPVRTGSIGGSLIVGLTNPNLDLTFLGLGGCRLLASLDVSLPVAANAPVTTIALPIPNQPALIGRTINTQVVLVDPALGGAIPAYLSNGLQWRFGN